MTPATSPNSGQRHHPRARRNLLVALAGLLLVAVVAVGYAELTPRERRYRFAMRDLLPPESSVPGWIREVVVVPPHRAQLEADILRYDDAVTMRYVRGGQTILVYVGYWTPGKMPSRLVASHAPDVCWEGHGWSCRYSAVASDLTTRGGHPIAPAQHRVMVHTGLTEHVLYWHHVGGGVRFLGSDLPRALLFLKSDLFQRGLNLREEQIFVRISGSMPLEELRRCDPVIEMFERMHFLRDDRR